MTKLCGRSRTSPACLECGGCSARGPARWAVRHPQCRCGRSCQRPSSSARQRDAARSTEPGWHPRKLLQASLLVGHGNFWPCGSGWRSTGTQTVTVEGMNVNMLNNTQKNTNKAKIWNRMRPRTLTQNQHIRELISTQKASHDDKQQQRSESPALTFTWHAWNTRYRNSTRGALTWHACEYKVHKRHQRLRGCTCGGVDIPCIYTHARWELP